MSTKKPLNLTRWTPVDLVLKGKRKDFYKNVCAELGWTIRFQLNHSHCVDHRPVVLAQRIYNMEAVNVLSCIGFGLCTTIIASGQFAIQRWKLELSVNEFCNTASWLSLPEVLLAAAKTQQYNNGADGACPRSGIKCSFNRERHCLCHYILNPRCHAGQSL